MEVIFELSYEMVSRKARQKLLNSQDSQVDSLGKSIIKSSIFN